MLPHILPYLAIGALHLFSGVSAAAIGTFPEYSGNHLDSRSDITKRDDPPKNNEPPQNDKPPQNKGNKDDPVDEEDLEDLEEDLGLDLDIPDLLNITHGNLEKVFFLMSQIPDAVIEKGTNATETWLENHMDSDITARSWWNPTSWGTGWHVIKCAGAIGAFIVENYSGIAKLGKLRKLNELKKAIDEAGGYKKAAKLLIGKGKGKHAQGKLYGRLKKLANEIIGVAILEAYC